MNKLLTGIVLLCFSIGAIAQEKQIWACQQEEGTLLNWDNGRWKEYGVNPIPLLLTIDGANSSYKMGDSERMLSCTKDEILQYISCLTDGQSQHLFFNPDTGKMGFSSLHGAVTTGDYRDSVAAMIFNCTKF